MQSTYMCQPYIPALFRAPALQLRSRIGNRVPIVTFIPNDFQGTIESSGTLINRHYWEPSTAAYTNKPHGTSTDGSDHT